MRVLRSIAQYASMCMELYETLSSCYVNCSCGWWLASCSVWKVSSHSRTGVAPAPWATPGYATDSAFETEGSCSDAEASAPLTMKQAISFHQLEIEGDLESKVTPEQGIFEIKIRRNQSETILTSE